MKFTCDSCGAAYMISDDKVGPSGVKVRCKKCGNVITVRKAEAAPVVAPAQAPAPEGGGFDDELGNAFDHAFGSGAEGAGGSGLEAPAGTPAPEEPGGPSAPAPIAVSGEPPAPPAPTEWYVAIGEAQVGPLPLAEVKRKWEAADIGPDSLVWRPGMGDWGPLSGVAELAAFLAPVARPQPVAAPAAAVTSVAAEPSRARAAAPVAAPAAMTPSPGAEIAWKPSGASALAALASEELVARTPSAAPAVSAQPTGRSIMEQLPDSGGVDPTGAIPLSIKGIDTTDERPARRSSVARGAEETRQRRGRRTLAIGAAALVVVAGAGGGAWYALGRSAPPPPAPAPAVAVQAPLPAPPPAPAPQAQPPAEPPVAAITPAATATPAAEAKPEAKTEVAKAPPPAPEPAKVEAPAQVAAARKPALKPGAPVRVPAPAFPAGKSTAVAAAPAERPAAAPGKRKDSVLDFDQGGSEDLDAALGNAGGRSVYVPPKPGGTAAPERLTDAQITESVKLHVDALRRCAAEQGAREPGAHGTLKMAWTIGQDGTPRDVRCLTPDLAQGDFAKCITGVVKGIRFPRITDARGQAVTFPFGY